MEMIDQGEYLVAGAIKDSMTCEPKAFVGGEIYDALGE